MLVIFLGYFIAHSNSKSKAEASIRARHAERHNPGW